MPIGEMRKFIKKNNSDGICSTNMLPNITAFPMKALALDHQTLNESNITQSQSNCSIREHHSRGTTAKQQTRHEPTDNTFKRTFFGVNVSIHYIKC